MAGGEAEANDNDYQLHNQTINFYSDDYDPKANGNDDVRPLLTRSPLDVSPLIPGEMKDPKSTNNANNIHNPEGQVSPPNATSESKRQEMISKNKEQADTATGIDHQVVTKSGEESLVDGLRVINTE